MALQMKTHHAASTAYRVRATCGIQKVLSSVLGYRLHFFPHVVASRQVEMISAFHLELDLFQFASEILDNLLRHDFIKKIKPIISPCFFVGNLRSYINPHCVSTSPSIPSHGATEAALGEAARNHGDLRASGDRRRLGEMVKKTWTKGGFL